MCNYNLDLTAKITLQCNNADGRIALVWRPPSSSFVRSFVRRGPAAGREIAALGLLRSSVGEKMKHPAHRLGFIRVRLRYTPFYWVELTFRRIWSSSAHNRVGCNRPTSPKRAHKAVLRPKLNCSRAPPAPRWSSSSLARSARSRRSCQCDEPRATNSAQRSVSTF